MISWPNIFLSIWLFFEPNCSLCNKQSRSTCISTASKFYAHSFYMWDNLRNPCTSCKKNFHFMVQWVAWHVSLSIPKNSTQKYPKLASLQHFEVDIPGNFLKWKFLFFWIFSKFCFENNFHFMTQRASWHVSLSIPKNHSQK